MMNHGRERRYHFLEYMPFVLFGGHRINAVSTLENKQLAVELEG